MLLYSFGDREVIMLPPARRCPSIQMCPLHSLYAALSVDFLFKAVRLLTVHQLLISGPKMGHHHTTSGMKKQSQLALFFSHGVFSQWQAHWLCVGPGWVCVPPHHCGTFLRYTPIQTEVEIDGVSQALGSLICNNSQAVYHCSPVPYQPVPCWEIYLRTVILSTKQHRDRTHRWLILKRHKLVYHHLVRGIYWSYCATDLLNHVKSAKDSHDC